LDEVRAVAAETGGAAGRIVSRPHIAEALRRKGYVASVQEAFDRYIGDGCPAYVAKRRVEPAEIIAAIHAAGGAAVLAHPVQLGCDGLAALEHVVRGLIEAGLDGLEVYHSEHTGQQTRQYLDLAVATGLLITGGSDYHGPSRPDSRPGRPRVPLSIVAEPWAGRWFAGPTGP